MFDEIVNEMPLKFFINNKLWFIIFIDINYLNIFRNEERKGY